MSNTDLSTIEAMFSNRGRANDDSDGDDFPRRTPRRTPMACTFCRGRKLKCDGRPICANCNRRGLPCTYVPVAAQTQKSS